MTLGFPLLAALLTPSLFYAGAAAVAAPILIHLLARRRFKRIRWAAMEFLIDAEKRNRRRLRMEEWILLALRCLAIFLIGLMLARPFLDPAGLAGMLGGGQRTERVFLLDDSYSMAYTTPDGTPFEHAKIAVQRIIEMVRRESPDDTVTMVRMSDVVRPIEAGTYLDDTQTQELLSRLEALSPSQRTINPRAAVTQLAELLDAAPLVTNAAVYVLSDFQRADWAVSDSKSAESAASVFAPLIEWAQERRGVQVVLVDLSVDGAANTAVTELGIESGQLIAGADAIVRAVVGNYGERSIEGMQLQASVGHFVQPSQSVGQVGAFQSASVDLRVEFPQSGYDRLRIDLPPDALPLDNTRYLAAEVHSAIRILVVNGQPSADPYDDEVTFLKTALRPEGREFSGNDVVVVDETELADTNLGPFHLVILANVYRIPDPVIEELERFVRTGGGLMVFAGDQLDADWYNGALYQEGDGLLPGTLTEIVRPAEPARLVLTDRLHPALRGLAKEGDPLGIGGIPFVRFFGSEPEGVTDDRSVGDGRISSGRNSTAEDDFDSPTTVGFARALRPPRVLARFDDPDEHPAIVERGFGAGHVIFIASTADKDWNQWPDHPTYLPMMMELARYTARRSGHDAQYLVGETITVELDPARYEADVVLRTPAFPNERETTITGQPDDGSGLALRWDHTEQSGIYQFVKRRRDGGETIRLVAVNVDSRESDLTPASKAELRRTAGDVPLTYIKGLEQIGGTTGEARTEMWRACLLAALFVLMSEQSLAWWWGRRR
jgi:hypothetical protein